MNYKRMAPTWDLRSSPERRTSPSCSTELEEGDQRRWQGSPFNNSSSSKKKPRVMLQTDSKRRWRCCTWGEQIEEVDSLLMVRRKWCWSWCRRWLMKMQMMAIMVISSTGKALFLREEMECWCWGRSKGQGTLCCLPEEEPREWGGWGWSTRWGRMMMLMVDLLKWGWGVRAKTERRNGRAGCLQRRGDEAEMMVLSQL